MDSISVFEQGHDVGSIRAIFALGVVVVVLVKPRVGVRRKYQLRSYHLSLLCLDDDWSSFCGHCLS